MAGYQVGIVSDTKAFKAGVDSGIIKPLEDAQRELDALGKSKGPDQLERDLKDAQKTTGRLSDELKKTAGALERAGKAGRAAGDDVDDGLGKMKAGAREVQQELGQNLGEAVSSIRGDLSDLGQVGQDTLGGLAATVSGMGPAGLAAAGGLAAAAVGWGLVSAGIEENEEKQRALNDAAAEWADVYTESASRIVSAAHVVAEINAIATDPDKYKTATENARNWGVNVSDAMRAMAGDTTAMQIAQDGLNGKIAEWNGLNDQYTAAIEKGTSLDQTRIDRMRELQDQVQAGTGALNLQSEAMALGQAQAENAARALGTYAASVGTATGATDELGNSIVALPDGKEVVIDAQTGKAYEDLDALEKKAIPEKTAKAKADTSAADKKSANSKHSA